jgi:uncharacterized protein
MPDNVEVIEAMWEAFGSGDADRAASALAPNAEIVSPDPLPWGGVYEGPEGFVQFLSALRSGIAGMKAKPLKILGADDNHVIVLAQTTGRSASGTRIEARVVWVYELRDGAVTRAEAFTDTAAILEALG